MNEQKYSLGVYEKAMPGTLDWRQKLQNARRAGYDFLEMSIDESDEKLARLDMDINRRIELQTLMLQEGFRIETMCLSGHRRFPMGSRDPAVRRQGMEIMEKAILLARDLGIRIIQIAGYDVYYEEGDSASWELFSQNLQRAVEQAARYGVMLAFETMETSFLNTVGKAMAWVKTSHSPYLAIYPDTGNITNASGQGLPAVLHDLRVGQGHIAALHLKESRPGIFREVPYGDGHVDFASLIATSYDLGVRRYLAEFWYTGSKHWEQELETSNRFLRSFLESAEQGAV